MTRALMYAVAAIACARAGTIVIQNVSVVDVATGVVRAPARVEIAARVDAVIDGSGKFLIPGLWDMHAQTGTEDRLRALVAEGVVGVRDFGTPWQRVAAWQASIERGNLVGPAVLASGEPVNERGPVEARAAFDRRWDLDVDFIGFDRGIAREAYIALAEQARHWRMRLAGPLPTDVAAWEAAEARQASIEGTDGAEALTDAALDRWALMGTRLTPLLSAAPEAQRATAYRTVVKARRAGVEILAGSGADVSLHQELEQLVAAGLSPREALEAATLAPRRLLQIRVEDLVLLDANPLVDIRNARRVAGVVLRGSYIRIKASK
jgi:imidazolonepropionase-like amidohydrolase